MWGSLFELHSTDITKHWEIFCQQKVFNFEHWYHILELAFKWLEDNFSDTITLTRCCSTETVNLPTSTQSDTDLIEQSQSNKQGKPITSIWVNRGCRHDINDQHEPRLLEVSNQWQILGGVKDVLPLSVQILSFLCCFQRNFFQIIGYFPHLWS